tara:strand:- start:874 stop:1545 length:672 start_codon:yes stop_codon:yes gene_type:complete
MSEIFLDTETTGLSFREGHRIVEIACVETKEYIPTGKIFHKLINPQRDVPEQAYNIHGFSTNFLKDKKIFKEIADEFLSFISDKKLIIHNASFDIGFLNFELGLVKKNQITQVNIIDSLAVARSKFSTGSNSLDALCKRFNIDLSKRNKHNALLDCELLREVYINLLDIKEPKLIFSSSTSDDKKFGIKKNSSKYCKRIIKPSNEELTKHENFLKKELKKNYY